MCQKLAFHMHVSHAKLTYGCHSPHFRFVYGGATESDDADSGIYILSLPGFRWFKADVDSPARMQHACTVLGNRQMMSTGGLTSEGSWKDEDPWRYTLGILDMTELEWKAGYDADDEEYKAPRMVQRWYSQGYVYILGRTLPLPSFLMRSRG